MIELQTGKEHLEQYNKEAEGIVHFALYEKNLEEFVDRIKDIDSIQFKKKEGNIIYNVENSKLVKIMAPEGTIVEIRNNEDI